MAAVASAHNIAPAGGDGVSKMQQKLTDFKLTDAGTGTQVSVAALAGSHDVVALDFFAPWCKACPAAAAELAKLAKRCAGQADKAFALVALECNEDDALDWAAKHGIEGVRLLVADEENLPEGVVPLSINGLPHKTVLKGGKVFANGNDIDLTGRFLEAAGHTIAGEAVAPITIESAAAEMTEAQQLAMTEGIPVGPSSQFYVQPPADFHIEEFRAFEKNEVMLRSNPGRWVMLPIKYPQIWEMYKKHEASFWTAEEIDLQSDLNDWENLTDNERHFLKHVLAFFAASDGIVLENLCSHFSTEVQLPEARAFYAFQAAMENIHSETYALLIETYLRNDEAEKKRLFNAIHTIPAVRKKAEWAVQWMCPESGCFAERLVAFAAVEGILFSGSFCALYFFKKRGLLPGLTFSNELIARDEGLHADFACLLYSMLEKKLPQSRVEQLVRGAVEVEREFICDALPCALIGMNNDLMTKYIEFVADRLLSSLGHTQVFASANPFSWMDMISLQGKTNFFEKRVGEYQKAGVMAGSEANNAFSLDEDF